jgi:hypothetical protein
LIGVALISPDFTASSRRMPPPYSFSVTSLRVSPSRASASVTVESLSDPNVLTPMTPPLRSAAVFTPGAAKKVKRMTLLKDPMVRMSPPLRLTRITEDNPTCMTSSRPGLEFGRAAAAAVHVDDVDLEPLRGIEAGIARHVPSQHRVDRVGDAGLELDRLLRGCRSSPDEKEKQESSEDACGARTMPCLHVRSSRSSACPHLIR